MRTTEKPIIRGRWDSFYEDKFFRKIFTQVKGLIKKEEAKKVGYKFEEWHNVGYWQKHV